MTQKKVEKSKGISKEELMGLKLVKVERISTQVGKNNTLIIIGKVEDEDSDADGMNVKYGIVTEPAVDIMLKSGFIEDDKVFLMLPDPDTNETMNWVNFLPEVEE